MSMIHFIGGEKGGVGKSVVSRLLSQYCLDRSQVYLGLDADQSHATLTRFYQEFTRPLNLERYESIDQIVELALAADQHILIDLPAQSQRFLDRWIEDNAVLDICAEMQIPLVYWYVVDDSQDSVQLVDSFLQKYQRPLQPILVKNLGCGADFSVLETLPTLLNAEAQGQLQQIKLPALHASTMRKIDQLNFSFWAAINLKNGVKNHLTMMERQRSKVWVQKAYGLFDQVMANIERPNPQAVTELQPEPAVQLAPEPQVEEPASPDSAPLEPQNLGDSIPTLGDPLLGEPLRVNEG